MTMSRSASAWPFISPRSPRAWCTTWKGEHTSSRATKIIYCCYGGTHSSAVAAAIHLGLLPRDRVPTREEILRVPYFDRVTAEQRGTALPAGVDKLGRQIFVLGRGREKRGIEAALRSGWRMAGGDDASLLFVDTLPCVNMLMRVGGFLSRAAGWVSLGRPIVVWGTQMAYENLCRLVERVEQSMQPAD